jgi:hypothetical protein
MEAQIQDIASTAGRLLVNPYLLPIAVAFAVALVTGVAGRVALFMEDLQYHRTHRADSRPSVASVANPTLRSVLDPVFARNFVIDGATGSESAASGGG